MYLLIYIYMYIYIYIYIYIYGKFVCIWHIYGSPFHLSSCYGSIPLTLGLIGRNGGLSTLCHGCEFACQQRVLKTGPSPGPLALAISSPRTEDEVVWLWHLLVNLNHIYSSIYILIYRLRSNTFFYCIYTWFNLKSIFLEILLFCKSLNKKPIQYLMM